MEGDKRDSTPDYMSVNDSKVAQDLLDAHARGKVFLGGLEQQHLRGLIFKDRASHGYIDEFIASLGQFHFDYSKLNPLNWDLFG